MAMLCKLIQNISPKIKEKKHTYEKSHSVNTSPVVSALKKEV